MQAKGDLRLRMVLLLLRCRVEFHLVLHSGRWVEHSVLLSLAGCKTYDDGING